jgi:hypothetical protein
MCRRVGSPSCADSLLVPVHLCERREFERDALLENAGSCFGGRFCSAAEPGRPASGAFALLLVLLPPQVWVAEFVRRCFVMVNS